MEETLIVEPEISDLRISNKLTVSDENLTIVTSSDEGIFDGDFDEDSLLGAAVIFFSKFMSLQFVISNKFLPILRTF